MISENVLNEDELEHRVKERTAEFEETIRQLRKEIVTLKDAESTLRESEKSYRNLVEINSDLIWEVDPKGVYTYVSPKVKDLLGYEPEEFIGKTPFDFMRQAEAERVRAVFRDISGSLKPFEGLENTSVHRNGQEVVFETSAVPILDSEGILLGYRGIDRDITGRKRAEKQILIEKNFSESIMRNLPGGFYAFDEKGKFLRWNKNFEIASGYSAEEISGMTAIDLFEGAAKQYISSRIKVGFSEGETDAEAVLVSKNGEKIPFYVIGSRVEIDGQAYIIGTGLETTKLRQAEQALQESEANLKQAQKIAHLGSWSLDLATHKITVSEEMMDIFKYSPEHGDQLDENAWRIYVHPDDLEKVSAAYEKVISGGELNNLEFRIIRSDGEIRTLFAQGDVIRDGSGKPVRMLGTGQDITERKRVEEALQFTNTVLKTQQETSSDGICVLDEQWKFLSFNQRFVDMWGIPPEVFESGSDELALQAVRQNKLVDPDQFLERVKYLYAHPEEKSWDEISLVGGITFERYSAPMNGPDGRYYGRVWYFRDITERKQAQEALRLSNERLSQESAHRKMLSNRLIELLEMDRQEIAMELHDHIGQRLTTLKMTLEMIRDKMETTDSLWKTQLTGAIDKSTQTIKEIKKIAHGLRPSVLDNLGLIPALHELFDEIKQHSDLDLHFFFKGVPERFTVEKELAVYRIIQQALNNIITHSQAKEVFVNLIRKGEALSISVEDDGIGFDPDKRGYSETGRFPMGLSIMKERAIQVGGEFTIESQIGMGTNLWVEIPL